MTSERGATLTLSKLTGIFGDEKRLGTEKSLLAVGSVINELSPELLRFGTISCPVRITHGRCGCTGWFDSATDHGLCCCP